MNDKPLTPEERRRILFAPITRGMLAEHHVGGKLSGGCGGDGVKQPVLGRDQQRTGWMKSPARNRS